MELGDSNQFVQLKAGVYSVRLDNVVAVCRQLCMSSLSTLRVFV